VAFSKSRQNLSEFSVLLLNRCVQLLSFFVVVLPMLRRLPHYRCYLDAVQERTRVSISVKKATTDRGAVEPYEFGMGHFWQLFKTRVTGPLYNGSAPARVLVLAGKFI